MGGKKKSKVQSANLALTILQGLMPIMTEPELEDVEDDTPCCLALCIVGTLSTRLSFSHRPSQPSSSSSNNTWCNPTRTHDEVRFLPSTFSLRHGPRCVTSCVDGNWVHLRMTCGYLCSEVQHILSALLSQALDPARRYKCAPCLMRPSRFWVARSRYISACSCRQYSRNFSTPRARKGPDWRRRLYWQRDSRKQQRLHAVL